MHENLISDNYYIKVKIFEDSIQKINAFIKEIGRQDSLIYSRAKCYFLIENYSKSKKDFKYLYKKGKSQIAISDAEIGTNIAKCFYFMNKWNMALKWLIKDGLGDSTYNEQILYLAALTYHKKDIIKSNYLFDKAINSLVSIPNKVMLDIANNKFDLDRFDDAVKFYNLGIEISSAGDENYYRNIGRRAYCNFKLNQFQSTVFDLNFILNQKEDKYAYYLRAFCNFQLGNFDNALEDIVKSRGYFTNGSDYYLEGKILEKKGMFSDAIVSYKYSIKKHWTDEAYFRITQCYNGIGDYSQALEALEIYSKSHPNCETCTEVRKELIGRINEKK